jgi:hypothetical protein
MHQGHRPRPLTSDGVVRRRPQVQRLNGPGRSVCVNGRGPVRQLRQPAGTLAERWTGRTWRIVLTPKSASRNSGFGGMACTLPLACTAVGSSGPVTTLAERWNSTRWRIQATQPAGRPEHLPHQRGLPDPVGLDRARAQLDRLGTADIGSPGVACPTFSAHAAILRHLVTIAVRSDRLARADIHPVSSDLDDLGVAVSLGRQASGNRWPRATRISPLPGRRIF